MNLEARALPRRPAFGAWHTRNRLSVMAVKSWCDMLQWLRSARNQMSTEALREASRHQFLGRRNELSAQLEMDCRKGQNGFGGRLRHETGCGPSGSNLYRISNRLGSVNRGGRSRAVLQRFQRLMSLLARNGPAARSVDVR